jgi:hypothetical protein
MTPSEIISVWMPKPPWLPAASRRPISSGIAPMPNWRIASGGMRSATRRAIAMSSGDASASGIVTSASSCSTHVSTSETCTRFPPSSGTPATRGMFAFTSAMASRSGSRAASRNGRYVAPACTPKLSQPSVVGRRRHGEDDPRLQAEAETLEGAEVRRLIRHPRPGGPREALDGTEEAAHDAYRGVLEERVGTHQQTGVENDVHEIAAGAERIEKASRLPGDEAAGDRVARPDEPRRRIELEPLPLRHRSSRYPVRPARGTAPAGSGLRRHADVGIPSLFPSHGHRARRRIEELRIDRSESPEEYPWRRRLLLLGLAVALVAVAAWWFLGGAPAAEVETAVVTEARAGGAAASVLDASGYVVARRQATVSSKVTGRLVEVAIEEGVAVKEGEVLARLDDSNARRALEHAEARVVAATSAQHELSVRLREAELQLGRVRELAKTGVESRRALDVAEAERDSFAAAARGLARRGEGG